MKKMFLSLATTALLLTLACSAFAHGVSEKRNKCNWFTKRYHVMARVSVGVPLCYQSGGHCDPVYERWGLHPNCIKTCGRQEAWYGWGSGSGTWGVIYQNICSRGYDIADLNAALLPDDPPGDAPAPLEESDIHVNDHQFSDADHSVQISGLTGRMYLDRSAGLQSYMKLTVWKANDDEVNGIEDSTIEDDEIIWQAVIQVTPGAVSIQGNIPAAALNIESTQASHTVQFNNLGWTVPVPAGIDMEDVVVTLESDAAPDAGGNLGRTIRHTEEALENGRTAFDVYPNPAVQEFSIGYRPEKASSRVTIALFDLSGRLVRNLYDQAVEAGQDIRLTERSTAYPKGMYYILINDGKDKLVKKLVIE